jgi:hypothetical protein
MIPIPQVQIGNRVAYEALSLFPLFAPANGGVDYLLSDKALATGGITVDELTEAGSVPNLVVNNQADSPVLFLEGEELRGAKQNRVLNASVLVGEHSKTVIPVSCVEQGRWRYQARSFASGGCHASPKMRGILKKSLLRSLMEKRGHRSNQGEIWQEVGRQMDALGAHSPTAAMADTYKKYEDRLAEFKNSLPYVEGATGLAIGIGKRIVSVDQFDKPATCRQIWNRLLTGVIMDALEEAPATEQVSATDVENMLGSARHATWKKTPAVGLGDEYRFETADLYASALSVGEVVIHGSLICAR